MKIVGIILFACGLVLLGACDSGNVEQVFNSEKRALQQKLNQERTLRLALQAYIDSILIQDTTQVMERTANYADNLFEPQGKLTPAKNGKPAPPPKIERTVALRNLENGLASWVQKLPPRDWKMSEVGTERLSLRASDQALFNDKTTTLSEKGKRKLSELSQQLKKQPLNQIFLQIESHVDSLPNRSTTHWEYGWQRAREVAEAMIEAGFPAAQLSIGSHGATAPVATNATEAGRYLNRRTLLILYVK